MARKHENPMTNTASGNRLEENNSPVVSNDVNSPVVSNDVNSRRHFVQKLVLVCFQFQWMSKFLNFVGQNVDNETGAIIISGFGLGNPWSGFRTLFCVMAYSVPFFSQSHLIAGAVYTGAVVGILFDIYCKLHLEYLFSGGLILITLVIVAVLNEYLPDRAN